MEKPMMHDRSETLAFEGLPALEFWRSEAFPEDLEAQDRGDAYAGESAAGAVWQRPLLMLVPLATAMLGIAAWVPVIVQ